MAYFSMEAGVMGEPDERCFVPGIAALKMVDKWVLPTITAVSRRCRTMENSTNQKATPVLDRPGGHGVPGA